MLPTTVPSAQASLPSAQGKRHRNLSAEAWAHFTVSTWRLAPAARRLRPGAIVTVVANVDLSLSRFNASIRSKSNLLFRQVAPRFDVLRRLSSILSPSPRARTIVTFHCSDSQSQLDTASIDCTGRKHFVSPSKIRDRRAARGSETHALRLADGNRSVA